MRAIIFDIDGTLALNAEADGPCFAEAFVNVFGGPPPSTNWGDYAYVTDWGILDQALGDARGRSSTLAERTAFEFAYRDAWQRHYAADPSTCVEVPGAAAVIAQIIADGKRKCGVATGGTRAAATFKLEAIGIDPAKLYGAFANDAIPRTAILRNALRATGARPNEAVYVGDGFWDVATCYKLGMPFIGVAAESTREELQAAGARAVIDDFQDQERFWALVDQAQPPRKT